MGRKPWNAPNPATWPTRPLPKMSPIRILNFVNGKFVEPVKSKYLDSFNPALGTINGKIPDSTKEDVDLAVEAADQAFKSWSQTTRSYRSKIMNKIADFLESRLHEFAELESQDQGKPLSLALAVDIPRAVYNFRFFASAILHGEGRVTELDGIAISYTRSEPVGVAALISPWNLPLYLLTWKIAPCIGYGCTAVCKPSEFTSVTAFRLCEIFSEAGLPNGVVNMVFGTGSNVGSPLTKHPKVPLLSFTGGTVTGKLVYAAGSEHNKKLSLELGGKNPNIVFADCDFEEAVATSTRAAFTNQGEICLCGSRIFVERLIFEKFVARMVETASKIHVGDPMTKAEGMQIGALVSQQHMEKVLGYIELSKIEGGKIHCGGERIQTAELKNGYFLRPTIITGYEILIGFIPLILGYKKKRSSDQW